MNHIHEYTLLLPSCPSRAYVTTLFLVYIRVYHKPRGPLHHSSLSRLHHVRVVEVSTKILHSRLEALIGHHAIVTCSYMVLDSLKHLFIFSPDCTDIHEWRISVIVIVSVSR